MRINEAGLALIKSFEKCVLSAYMPTPNDVPTIGYGHTRNVHMGDLCTQEQADQWLLDDIAEFEDCVSMSLEREPNENQYSAMVSLAFNIGCGNFRTSTLVKLMNQGNAEGASGQFSRWNKQAGKVLNGLTRRRQAEKELFDASVSA